MPPSSSFNGDAADVDAWLRVLGLERYAQAFQENEIDAEILRKLDANDLKDIGVVAVGHRRWLLEAIAELRGSKGQVGPSITVGLVW